MKKHILKQIRKYLKQTEYYLTRNEEKCKKIYKLTPTDTIKDSSYLEILKESIDDEELTNIALTGPYGSGKSSIIKAFEKYYSYRDDYKFLNISLATFKDNLKKTEEKNEMSLPEYEQIEKSILQQMFYKVEQKSIPNSRFKRIKTTKNTTFKTSMILLWGASIIELFSPHTFIYHFYNKFDLTFLFTGVFTIGSIYFVDLLLKRTSNIKLEKLSLQSPEINLSNNDSDISILNKHIDEIIYFFDETDYNIVVIEDLDRFNNAEIFTKLREINTLINNRKGKAPITFLYAIKDDMFKDKDRTKFFDFLIPVIPIINSSNSFNLLKGIFEENNLIEHVDKQFLKEISLYINDMRFLKNVFNEFLQYKDRLRKNIDLDYNKLFAIAIYKNTNPEDFSKLHNDEGIVYELFTVAYKEQIVNKLTEDISKRVKDYELEIKSIEQLPVGNINELRALYIFHFIKKVKDEASNDVVAFYVGNRRVSISETISNDSDFNNIKLSQNIRYYSNNGYERPSQISFNMIEDLVDKTKSYDEKEILLLKKLETEDNKLKDLITEQKEQIKYISTLSIAQLVNKFGKEEILERKIIEDEVLSYLIRYGHIDKDYYRYVSYFHEGSETPNDINFTLNIKKDGPSMTYSLPLTEKMQILNDLRDDEFKRNAVLNYDLLEFLFNRRNSYKIKYNNYLDLITRELKDTFEFIDGFVNINEQNANILKDIVLKCPDLWYFILNESNIDEKGANIYITLFINILDVNDLKILNIESLLSDYIGNIASFNKLSKDISDSKLFDALKSLVIKFKQLDDMEPQQSAFDNIYKNNLYQINTFWINKILQHCSIDNLNSKNYTSIKTSDKKHLIDYIDSNINKYVENVYLKLENNKYEDEKYLIVLLNDEEVTLENKKLIISRTKTLIEDISYVIEDLWDILINDKKFLPCLSNIKKLITSDNIKVNSIIKYLNDKTIAKEVFGDKLDSKTADNSNIENIMFFDDISMETFKFYVNSLDFVYEELKLNTMQHEKVNYIIDKNKIDIHPANYFNLLENHTYDKLAIKFLESHPGVVMKNHNDFEISTEHIVELVKGDKFNISQKLELLNSYCPFTFPEDSKFLDKVYGITLCDINEFDVDPYLNLIESTLDLDKKMNLFLKYQRLNRSSIDITLNNFGKEYQKLTYVGHGPIQIIKDNYMEKVTAKLKKVGYISNVKPHKKDENKLNIYPFLTPKEVL